MRPGLVVTLTIFAMTILVVVAAVTLEGCDDAETALTPPSTLLPPPTQPTVPLPTDPPPPPSSTSTTPTTSPVTPAGTGPGAELYTMNCAVCHGANRGGGAGPELSAATMRSEYPDVADQVEVVLGGFGDMDGFEGTLTAEQVRAVVDYTRQG